ncbi:MAG: DUF6350 family protein, partial [Propionibacteriaceae bacterium]|nr:DUF6350 family protein [Propionibacteriaceae bacterium]
MEVESVTTRLGPPPAPAMAWWLAAGAGPLAVVLAGWAIVACPAVIARLAATGEVSQSNLLLATRLWLLAHGGPAVIDGLRVSLIPLGVTVLCGLMLRLLGSYAAQQAVLSRGRVSLSQAQRRSIALAAAGTATAVYAAVATVTAILVDPAGPAPFAGAGAFALAAVSTFLGARSAAGWQPQRTWPAWTRAIPRAALSALVILLIGGVVATTASLIAHRAVVASLTEQLGGGFIGTIVLCLLQGAYLPNVVIWAASWTTGAGFSLGACAEFVLMGHQVETLPNLPLVGALPAVTPAPWTTALWLLWGVLAGVAAAVVVVRARPRARCDETALAGGLAGAAAGLLFTLVALSARGGLGTGRLVSLGPLPLAVTVLATTLLGLSGVVAGFTAGLLRPPPGGSDFRDLTSLLRIQGRGQTSLADAAEAGGLAVGGDEPQSGSSQTGWPEEEADWPTDASFADTAQPLGGEQVLRPVEGTAAAPDSWTAVKAGRAEYGVDGAEAVAGALGGDDMAEEAGAAARPTWWRRLRPRREADAAVFGAAASGGPVAEAGQDSEAPAADDWEDSARLRDLGVRRVLPGGFGASDETTGPVMRRLAVPPTVIPLVSGPAADGPDEPTAEAPDKPFEAEAGPRSQTIPMTSPFGHDPAPPIRSRRRAEPEEAQP